MISRFVEPVLRQFDNEDREWVLRWRLWKMDWFPYRTAEMLFTDDGIEFGPWTWHKPKRFQ